MSAHTEKHAAICDAIRAYAVRAKGDRFDNAPRLLDDYLTGEQVNDCATVIEGAPTIRAGVQSIVVAGVYPLDVDQVDELTDDIEAAIAKVPA